MKANNARKFILIPEWAPLYAMRECYGPTHGPLKEPTPTPIDIIGKLLLQTGKEALTIHEVIREGKGFSKPVRLTKENYKLPYEEIAGIVQKADQKDEVPTATAPVEPVYIDDIEKISAEDSDKTSNGEDASETYTSDVPVAETDISEITETPSESDEEIVPEEPAVETSEATSTDESVVDPYAGMSKSQRKKARREEAARRALEEVIHTPVLDDAPSEDSEDESSIDEE